jgi:hypothetical protein
MTAPHAGAKVKQVRRRDPGLRESADQQQLPKMPGVSPVSLRSPLLALQAARFRRLGQMSVSTNPLPLLDHEPPTGCCFQRNLEIAAIKPGQEPADSGAISRRDPRGRDLPGDRVDPLRRDLRTVLIDPHHQRHAIILPSTGRDV